ncbi:hypothetical protein [Oricola indica]|jgi:hypothetical protein|uniref:hypothetical protein n=1 Tax=Oricola indica TaxID=2872591 RepID=UPI001CBFC395|nr:hypothetical protein [Oricola indica]
MLVRYLTLTTALLFCYPSLAADLSCNGLVAPGQSLVCAGFEPNWAIELKCDGALTSNFTDAFSGNIAVTAGSVAILAEDPWQFETSHPVAGTIAYTPAGCMDESDRIFDFTFTPTAAPGLAGPFHPFCCRIE